MNDRFRVVPLDAELARRVRKTRLDVAGNAVQARRDAARHQCRLCLTLTAPEEPYLALSHQPFDSPGPFAERGPVYLHERECEPYRDASVYPPEFPRREVVLRAYGHDHEIEDARLPGERPVEDVIAELLADERVAYLHARNAAYGCFMFRIDRA
jgi:hypothetical protein